MATQDNSSSDPTPAPLSPLEPPLSLSTPSTWPLFKSALLSHATSLNLLDYVLGQDPSISEIYQLWENLKSREEDGVTGPEDGELPEDVGERMHFEMVWGMYYTLKVKFKK